MTYKSTKQFHQISNGDTKIIKKASFKRISPKSADLFKINKLMFLSSSNSSKNASYFIQKYSKNANKYLNHNSL